MVPYTYYRLCESERGADGRSRQRTVLGLGELADFPTDAERRELAELPTELIRDGRCRMSYTPGLYDAALGFYGKWIDEKREAEQRRDELAEKARIEGKGTKQRDKVNRRLGRLNQRHPGFEKRYTVDFTYSEKGMATAMSWQRLPDSRMRGRKCTGNTSSRQTSTKTTSRTSGSSTT